MNNNSSEEEFKEEINLYEATVTFKKKDFVLDSTFIENVASNQKLL